MSDLAKEAAKFIQQTKRLAAKSKEQVSVETTLERELEDCETVIAFKKGTDYRYMTCKHCGERAGWTVTDPILD